MPNQSISLTFANDIGSIVRSRIDYCFRVFAAVYGYRVLQEPQDADICIVYGRKSARCAGGKVFRIAARYRCRALGAGTPILEKHRYANQEICLVHGLDPATGNPDWLGEIFEWLSASFELGIEARDSVGRIPYQSTVFAQQGISPFRPHAGIIMAWLQNALHGEWKRADLPRANSPIAGVDHAVICSHDIDFYYSGRARALERLAKNWLISIRPYRSPSFLVSNLKLAARVISGGAIGDYIPRMLDAIESLGFRSTLFAVTQGKHRRDPDYRIENIAPDLRNAVRRGFGVGIHASYDSAFHSGMLKSESKKLENIMCRKAAGSRQHWLRFSAHGRLYQNIEDAGLAYDSSLGFAETCGFRNGASFAFPPYDLDNERPCSFLEIPLAIMDGGLERAARSLRKAPQELVNEILDASRRVGWGGIAVLWHNPVEAVQVPDEINQVFWRSAQLRGQYREQWMSAEEFMKGCLARYQQAGLLQDVRLDA